MALPPLESYDVERMLEVIFDGFDAAFALAGRFVLHGTTAAPTYDAEDRDVEMMILRQEEDDHADGEDDWEFMVDAMDWEAV